MNAFTLIIIVLLAILLIYIFIIYPTKYNRNVENNNEYGSARFATEKEIKKDFKRQSLDNIEEFGFPIWFDKNLNNVWMDNQTPHWLFLGSTGSGKSLTSVKPQSAMIANAKIKRSVFFSDPKGELFSDTSQMFEENGYEVITLDFRNPTLSAKINLLQPVIDEWKVYLEYKKKADELELESVVDADDYEEALKILDSSFDFETLKRENALKTKEEVESRIADREKKIKEYTNISMDAYAEASRLVGSIADMICSEENSKDPFFPASAGNLLAGLIFFFLEEYEKGVIEEDKITLNSILKFQISTTEEQNAKKFKKIIEKLPYTCNSKLRLNNVIGASENTYKSITSVFGQKMAIFNDLNVANVTSSSDFSFDCLGKGIVKEETYIENGEEKTRMVTKPVAMYVIVRDEDESYNILITLIVGIMYKCLVRLAVNSPKQKCPIGIEFMLDEFANCPPLPSISAMVTVARSRNMRFQFYIQEFSQLDKVYGKEVANIIKGNAGLVYLKTTSYETAEAISKRLGKQTIQNKSISRGTGWGSSLNVNNNLSLMGRELFTPDEIMGLEYKTIIFPIKKSFPIFRDTIPFFTFTPKHKTFHEGAIERIPFIMSTLEDKLFSVEQINDNDPENNDKRDTYYTKMQKTRMRNQTNRIMHDTDAKLLEPAINQIKNIISEADISSIEYLPDEYGRTYGKITTTRRLTENDKFLIDKLNFYQDKAQYKVIQTDIDNYATIEVFITDVNIIMRQIARNNMDGFSQMNENQ